MKKVFVSTPAILEQAYKNGLLCGVILFGSSIYKPDPKDIDLAIITSIGNFDDFVGLLSTDSSLSVYDVSLIKREEIDSDKKFYFGSHGQYLVESLRQGTILLGENPFLNFPKTEIFDIKRSIVDRMREYIYVLRKSYFDEQAEIKFISRYDKMILLSAFLLLDGFSYTEIFTFNKNHIEVELKKKGYLLFSDKKRNIEEIWTNINKQY